MLEILIVWVPCGIRDMSGHIGMWAWILIHTLGWAEENALAFPFIPSNQLKPDSESLPHHHGSTNLNDKAHFYGLVCMGAYWVRTP